MGKSSRVDWTGRAYAGATSRRRDHVALPPARAPCLYQGSRTAHMTRRRQVLPFAWREKAKCVVRTLDQKSRPPKARMVFRLDMALCRVILPHRKNSLVKIADE